MIVIMFQPRFVVLIEAGLKRTTIRLRRKGRQVRTGDKLSLRTWTGDPYRSKQRILANVDCVEVESVELSWEEIREAGIILRLDACAEMARVDGFDSIEDMLRWFAEVHTLPFTGVLIRW
jgi:hypothetical protein